MDEQYPIAPSDSELEAVDKLRKEAQGLGPDPHSGSRTVLESDLAARTRRASMRLIKGGGGTETPPPVAPNETLDSQAK